MQTLDDGMIDSVDEAVPERDAVNLAERYFRPDRFRDFAFGFENLVGAERQIRLEANPARHGMLRGRCGGLAPVICPPICGWYPHRPHEQHTGPVDRGEQGGKEALVL